MSDSIILQNLNAEQLKKLIDSSLSLKMDELKKELVSTKTNETLLTRKEACEFLKIDSSTLWHWTNKGKIKAYSIAHRRYYKIGELLEALKPVIKL